MKPGSRILWEPDPAEASFEDEADAPASASGGRRPVRWLALLLVGLAVAAALVLRPSRPPEEPTAEDFYAAAHLVDAVPADVLASLAESPDPRIARSARIALTRVRSQ